MEEFGTDVPREDIYSKAVRAGKRTYFFDVKSTRSNELYLTITESKRRFNQQTGKFFYEKHKLFLYQEDFDKFKEALEETFMAIGQLQGEIIPKPEYQQRRIDESSEKESSAQKTNEKDEHGEPDGMTETPDNSDE